jgi:general secretion pathway protein D
MKRNLMITAILLVFVAASIIDADAEQAAELSISPSLARTRIGREVSIRVEVREGKDVFGAPFYLIYDPNLLEVVQVSQGDFFKKDGKQSAFLQKVDSKAGRIIIGQTRMGKVGGMTGTGTLVKVTFKAVHRGKASLSLDNVDFRNSRLSSLEVHTQPGVIEVK